MEYWNVGILGNESPFVKILGKVNLLFLIPSSIIYSIEFKLSNNFTNQKHFTQYSITP
jgi:hypothetical protein